MTIDERSRRWLRVEIVLVLAVSLGASAVQAIIDLIGRLTAPQRLKDQQAILNGSQAVGRPWLDLAYQLFDLAYLIAPAFLALYLIVRSGDSLRSVGVDRDHPRWDIGAGCGLALLIGLPGLGLYLAAHALGINASVIPTDLPDVWWRYPVLILSAVQNAVLEEVVVVAYLITRLERLGRKPKEALGISAVLRGSYHLYQGFGGFLGNLVMGLIFGYVFQRTRRVLPMVIAHSLIDCTAFVGYALLAGHVSWLPK